jgi:hypothetical protein
MDNINTPNDEFPPYLTVEEYMSIVYNFIFDRVSETCFKGENGFIDSFKKKFPISLFLRNV